MKHSTAFVPVVVTAASRLEQLFGLQRAASRQAPAPDAGIRRQRLETLRQLVLRNEARLIDAISQDFGNRSADETRLLEMVVTLNAIRHARRHLARWMRPERRHVDVAFKPARAWVRHEPLGVIGVIAPWNYPLQLTLVPLVEAIAAGNRAMIKPSELTPRFSELLATLVAEMFDPTEVAVVTGGVEVAQAFAALPFDHLVFTGSTEVGRRIMAAAAPNLTPVTLELGGKSPAIVCPDANIERAARSIAFGKFVNAGQTCVAPDYALVPAGTERDFAEAVLAAARRAYPTVAANPDYTAMISNRHFERLSAAVEAARAAGAAVLSHGDEAAAASRKITPTVVIGAPRDSLLMREEIFGPVLPIIPYRDLDDALAFVRAGERPLALYAFTHDRRSRDRILDGAISGGVTLNGTLLHVAQEDLPFGGVGASGMGSYHGRDGFRRFSHARAVHAIGWLNAFELMGPPWGRLAGVAARLLSHR